jgi:hypothetical protein
MGQFEYISQQVQRVQKRGQPVVSVDTKKKELLGDFKNPGQEWRPKAGDLSLATVGFAEGLGTNMRCPHWEQQYSSPALSSPARWAC